MLRRDDAVAEVRDELAAHFEGTVSLLMSRGWTEADARAEARRRFGDEGRYRAELERDARRRSLRRHLVEATRTFTFAAWSALRGVRRTPGLSAAVVATLALGLGANAAIFGVVDRLLLSAPPHIERSEEVRRLYRNMTGDDGDTTALSAFSYSDVLTIRSAAPDVPVAAIMSYLPETTGSGAEAVRLRIGRVDAEYFPLLGVQPAFGRGLLSEDHRDAAAVAVLGDAAWRAHFGADSSVIGRRIRAERGTFEIVGVMPPGFYGSHAPAIDLWIPVEAEAQWGMDWRGDETVLAFSVIARAPPEPLRAAWEARVEDALRAAPPRALRMTVASFVTTSLVPGSAPNAPATIAVSRWLAAVSLLVLLAACANCANLFLAHAEKHRRETAVRLALGAGPGALRTELLARSLCLALLGAAGAALTAFWIGRLFDGLFLADLDVPANPSTTRLLVVTAALGILASLLAGLFPALRAPRSDVRTVLESGLRASGGTGAVRRVLATVQVALCMVLLVGAGLFVSSFRNAHNVDLGFAHDQLLMIRLDPEDEEATSQTQLLAAAQDRIRALPSVIASSGTVAVPFRMMYGANASLPGGEAIEGLHVNSVGADFFRTMNMHVLRGRAFDERDTRTGAEPVVVVSRRAAERLWPDGEALGECLRIGRTDTCARVIGVAVDHAGVALMPDDLAPPTTMQAWVPQGFPGVASPIALLVRTASAPAHVLDEIRRAAAVPGVRYVEIEPMSEIVNRQMRSWRLGAAVFSLFGLIAVLVAGVGLYGVLAFEVAQRRRELGIRVALGADRLRVLKPVVRFALPVVLTGLAAGALVAVSAAGRVGSLLYDVEPRDPRILAAAAFVIVILAAAALLLPAWRAAHVDPRETLG